MSEKIFVPPLKIQGIKTKLVPLIRENVILDKETIWYEPFMGSGVVGFNVEPERAVFADVNPHIINFYNRNTCFDILFSNNCNCTIFYSRLYIFITIIC